MDWGGFVMNDNMLFWALAAILFVLACILVLRKIEISVGQTTLFVLAAILVIFPFVANFEFSNGTLKFTTKEQTSDLTAEVKDILDRQATVSQSAADLALALKKTTDRVTALEKQLQARQPDITLPSSTKISPGFWDTLKNRNDGIIIQNKKSITNVDRLQRDLKAR